MWSANYGNLHIIVCDMHRETFGRQLTDLKKVNRPVCFFCVNPNPWWAQYAPSRTEDWQILRQAWRDYRKAERGNDTEGMKTQAVKIQGFQRKLNLPAALFPILGPKGDVSDL